MRVGDKVFSATRVRKPFLNRPFFSAVSHRKLQLGDKIKCILHMNNNALFNELLPQNRKNSKKTNSTCGKELLLDHLGLQKFCK